MPYSIDLAIKFDEAINIAPVKKKTTRKEEICIIDMNIAFYRLHVYVPVVTASYRVH